MLCKVIHCTGHVWPNTRPRQLQWSCQEMETVILCHISHEYQNVLGYIIYFAHDLFQMEGAVMFVLEHMCQEFFQPWEQLKN